MKPELIFLSIPFALLFANPSFSMEIREDHFQYSSDVVVYESDTTYLIGDFPSMPLLSPPSRVIQKPSLQLRTSSSETPIAKDSSTLVSRSLNDPSPTKKARACQISPLLFQLDSANVNPLEVNLLVEQLRKCNATKVSVEGFTCDLGEISHNDRLALARANHTAEALRTFGFIPVEIKGKGKHGYITNDPAKRHLNRRVLIQIKNGE